MKKSLTILLLLTLLAAGHVAVGAWSMDPKTVAISYSGTALNSSQTLTIRRTGTSGVAPFYLLITAASVGSVDPGLRRAYLGGVSEYESALQIYIRRATGTTEITSVNTAGAYALVGSIANGSSSVNVSFKLASAAGRMPTGMFSNVFTVQIFTGTQTPPNGVPDATGTLTVNLNSTQTATMTMSLSNGGLCSFGTMSAGNSYTASVTLTVTASSTFTISAFSENGSKLMLAPGETINYTFTFAGTTKDLTNGTVKLVTSTTNAINKAYTLQFVTETIAFPEAGDYTDSLYLMFTTG
jgi:hypothetical protein